MTEVNIIIPDNMDSETAKRFLINSIYKVAVQFYENIGEHGKLSDGKKLLGNGHHMAQDIADKAGELWVERLTK